ncbi:hypothetical protein G6011_03656 [Alternaria panax]|uniref:Uncharacterized protein n=1 Tax=Alternaria panax TaxID=48097 RepID=A0AAD4IFT4_9PLEO|nr:hypothetical protein G6011_03656 [Alternaria panax]
MSQSLSTEINGFYGPGSWAAWVITMIVSWIPILQNDYESNLHYMLYALYTNWATIDAIRWTVQASRAQTELVEVEKALVERLVTSLAVVELGVAQAVFQISLCLLREDKESDSDEVKRKRRRRVWLITLGLLLPISLWGYSTTIPSLHQDRSRVVVVLQIIVLLLSYFGFPVAFGKGSEWTWFLQPMFFLLWPTMFNPAEVGTKALINSLFSPIHLGPRERCHTVSCAPQTIGELDQAFSLFVALFMYLYEFGFSHLWILKGFILGFPNRIIIWSNRVRSLGMRVQAWVQAEPVPDEEVAGDDGTFTSPEAASSSTSRHAGFQLAGRPKARATL